MLYVTQTMMNEWMEKILTWQKKIPIINSNSVLFFNLRCIVL